MIHTWNKSLGKFAITLTLSDNAHLEKVPPRAATKYILSYDRVGDIDSKLVKLNVEKFITDSGDGKINSDNFVESTILFESAYAIDHWKSKAVRANELLKNITIILIQGFSGSVEDVYFKRGKTAP
jgi:hypothetical protein